MNEAKSDLEKAAGNFKALARLISRKGLHLTRTQKKEIPEEKSLKEQTREQIRSDLKLDSKIREAEKNFDLANKPKYKDLEIQCCMDYLSYFKGQSVMKNHVYEVLKDRDLVYFKTNLNGYCSMNSALSDKAKERLLNSIQIISKVETQKVYPGLKEIQSEIEQHPAVKLINERNREISKIYLQGLQTMLKHPRIMEQFRELQKYFDGSSNGKSLEKGEIEYIR